MPTLRQHGCMIADRAGRRRARRLRWNIERAKEKQEAHATQMTSPILSHILTNFAKRETLICETSF
jgi:hypothetical protein